MSLYFAYPPSSYPECLLFQINFKEYLSIKVSHGSQVTIIFLLKYKIHLHIDTYIICILYPYEKCISYCECPSQRSWIGSQAFSVHRALSVSVIFSWCPQAPKKYLPVPFIRSIQSSKYLCPNNLAAV